MGKGILFQRVALVLGKRGWHGTARCVIGLGLSVLGLHVLGAMTNFRVHEFLEFHSHGFGILGAVLLFMRQASTLGNFASLKRFKGVLGIGGIQGLDDFPVESDPPTQALATVKFLCHSLETPPPKMASVSVKKLFVVPSPHTLSFPTDPARGDSLTNSPLG